MIYSHSNESTIMTFTFNFEKGDDLFDVLFELDRKLQTAQQTVTSTTFLTETYGYIDAMMLRAIQTQPDIIDPVFLKLVDFFIKCNSNYKRSKLSHMMKSSSAWLDYVKSKSEAFRRICQLWDSTVSTDFEASRQILLFMASCHQCFHTLSASYGIFYEALESGGEDESIGGKVIFQDLAISTCAIYIRSLFKESDLVAIKNFASLAIFHAILPLISDDASTYLYTKNDKLQEILFICTNLNPSLSKKLLKSLNKK